ncbi:MAG: hypothetical protein JWQ27_1846 [Ferruginibacter sp.]|nr:hypothetical protein [Ferruginibacter sp.]
MPRFLYKWLIIASISLATTSFLGHPIFVSVTEIEHNAKEKTLEVSCKIFTDDFEKTLRAAYNTHVDLLDAKYKPAMDRLVNDYVQKHVKINIDGKAVTLKYLGYEQLEEGIYSYYQADNIPSVKKISVTDNLLYEYKKEQLSFLHVTVNGSRKSTKLNNPDDKVTFDF